MSPKPSPSAHTYTRDIRCTTTKPHHRFLFVWSGAELPAKLSSTTNATLPTQGHLSTITSTPPPLHICVVSARATFQPVGDQVTRKKPNASPRIALRELRTPVKQLLPPSPPPRLHITTCPLPPREMGDTCPFFYFQITLTVYLAHPALFTSGWLCGAWPIWLSVFLPPGFLTAFWFLALPIQSVRCCCFESERASFVRFGRPLPASLALARSCWGRRRLLA